MEKAITTALFMIASVAAALALINGVLPAVGKSSSALLVANASASERIKTDHKIIFVGGDSTANEVVLWAKNVGTETIDLINEADLFLTNPNDSVVRIEWASTTDCPTLIAGGTECWEFQFEDSATTWVQGVTIRITVRLNSVTIGVYKVKLSLRNGVTTQKEFSV